MNPYDRELYEALLRENSPDFAGLVDEHRAMLQQQGEKQRLVAGLERRIKGIPKP